MGIIKTTKDIVSAKISKILDKVKNKKAESAKTNKIANSEEKTLHALLRDWLLL